LKAEERKDFSIFFSLRRSKEKEDSFSFSHNSMAETIRLV